MPWESRNNPCVQNGVLTLAGCRGDIRNRCKIGDFITGVRSTSNGKPAVLLFMAKVEAIIAAKDYYAYSGSFKGVNNVYGDRRDNNYGINNKGDVILRFKEPGIAHFIYYFMRQKQNVGGGDAVIVWSKNYKVYADYDQPDLTAEAVEFIKRKTRDYGCEPSVAKEMDEIWCAKSGIFCMEEWNQYDVKKYGYDMMKTVLSSGKDWFKLFQKPQSYQVIAEYIENMGGVPINPSRNNVRRGNEVIRSVTFGTLGLKNGEVVKTRATTNNFELFVMLVAMVQQKFGLRLDEDYGALCLNQNLRSALHKDGNNKGISYALSWGDHTGGKLLCGKDGRVALDIYHNACQFDGREWHQTAPFEGTRYSLILFTHKKHNI